LEGQGAAAVEREVRGLRQFQVRGIDAPMVDPNGITVAPTL
jgi:hypothetical protein